MGKSTPHLQFYFKEEEIEGIHLSSPKIVITFSGPLRSYTVKENYIGSVVSYRQKSLLLYIIGCHATKGLDI